MDPQQAGEILGIDVIAVLGERVILTKDEATRRLAIRIDGVLMRSGCPVRDLQGRTVGALLIASLTR